MPHLVRVRVQVRLGARVRVRCRVRVGVRRGCCPAPVPMQHRGHAVPRYDVTHGPGLRLGEGCGAAVLLGTALGGRALLLGVAPLEAEVAVEVDSIARAGAHTATAAAQPVLALHAASARPHRLVPRPAVWVDLRRGRGRWWARVGGGGEGEGQGAGGDGAEVRHGAVAVVGGGGGWGRRTVGRKRSLRRRSGASPCCTSCGSAARPHPARPPRPAAALCAGSAASRRVTQARGRAAEPCRAPLAARSGRRSPRHRA